MGTIGTDQAALDFTKTVGCKTVTGCDTSESIGGGFRVRACVFSVVLEIVVRSGSYQDGDLSGAARRRSAGDVDAVVALSASESRL